MILAPHPLSLPLRSLIIIVASGEMGGGAKILQKKMAPPPPSVIKIVKCCGVWGVGIVGCQNPTKDNGAPSLCH